MFFSTERPYYKHAKAFSTSWRHLRVLADFMQVGTTPLRWKEFQEVNDDGKPGKWSGDKPYNQKERLSRTKVTRLDYLGESKPSRENYKTASELRDALKKQAEEDGITQKKFRLFVVEDLSSDVIEMLGAHYDIEPAFFRDQIFDYAWYKLVIAGWTLPG